MDNFSTAPKAMTVGADMTPAALSCGQTTILKSLRFFSTCTIFATNALDILAYGTIEKYPK